MITTFLDAKDDDDKLTMMPFTQPCLSSKVDINISVNSDSDEDDANPPANITNITLYPNIPIPSFKMDFSEDEQGGEETGKCDDDRDVPEIVVAKYNNKPKMVQKTIDGKVLKRETMKKVVVRKYSKKSGSKVASHARVVKKNAKRKKKITTPPSSIKKQLKLNFFSKKDAAQKKVLKECDDATRAAIELVLEKNHYSSNK